MKKLNRSFFVNLIATMAIIVAFGCAGASKKSSDSNSYDSATNDSASAVSSPVVVGNETKPDVKRAPIGTEDALSQAIKRQNDADIVKASHDLLMANPANAKALNALGMSNYKKGKYKAAEYFLNKALTANSNESGLYNNLAMVKLAQGEQREAVKLLKSGLSQKSEDIGILTNLGAIYVAQKDYPIAEVVLETVFKNGTKDVKVLSNYATSLAANKKYAEATSIYKRLMSDNGSSREIMLNYSVHLIENIKDYKQGLELINRLKFVGAPEGARNLIIDLENKAKSGVK